MAEEDWVGRAGSQLSDFAAAHGWPLPASSTVEFGSGAQAFRADLSGDQLSHAELWFRRRAASTGLWPIVIQELDYVLDALEYGAFKIDLSVPRLEGQGV